MKAFAHVRYSAKGSTSPERSLGCQCGSQTWVRCSRETSCSAPGAGAVGKGQRMIGHPLKVRELLDEITRGMVLLPEIQRAYVWKGPQVAKLLDSLYREYPAGQILLWDTVELPILTKHLEGIQPPALPSADRPKIVLDGQQRLTSLHKALGKEANEIDIYFNLDSEQFQRYQRRLKNDPLWVSVRAVLSGDRHDLKILQDIEAAGG